MRVLVTGGTGYIGSHTTVELQNAGFDALIVDNLSNSDKKSLDGIEAITGVRPDFEEFDLVDRKKVFELFEKYDNIVGIIHFAAHKAVGESVEQPLKYYDNNINSLLNLLMAMEKYNVPSMVFSSSCTVYGQPEKLPVTENAPLQKATSPYGNTKQICEDIINDTIGAIPELRAISLRYFNPIGAHPSANIGELPLGTPQNLVPFVTQTAAGLRKELSVFGDDYKTKDGTCIRDYIHVVDLAKAHVVALDRLIKEHNVKPVEVFNIGTGQGSTVLEVIKTFETVSDKKLPYRIVGRRSGDTEAVWADTQKVRAELNWEAKSSLADALSSAWKWEKKIRNIE
ncbi:MAG: UDP-glucose 4-epimerase GalE [Bacteroidales bacterium]